MENKEDADNANFSVMDFIINNNKSHQPHSIIQTHRSENSYNEENTSNTLSNL